jgi:membrane protease YdiL (CAAX protease family)
MKLIKNRFNEVYSGIKIVMFLLFYFAMLIIINNTFISTIDFPNQILLIFVGKTTSVIILIIGFLLVYYIEHRSVKQFGIILSKKTFKDFYVGLFLGMISIIVISSILFMTNNAKITYGITNPTFSVDIVYLFFAFIMVGIDEELLVRGYMVHTLLRYNNKYVVYIVPAVIFSALHGLNPNVSTLGLINIVLVGILFTYMTLKTQNILMAIGFHITWNFFQGGFFGFNVSGNHLPSIYPVSIINDNILTGGDFGLEGGILTTICIIIMTFIVYRLPSRKSRNL